MELSQAETETIEKMIDSHSLSAVLGAIEQICYGKAEHIATNWQDEGLATLWERSADKLDRALTAANLLP